MITQKYHQNPEHSQNSIEGKKNKKNAKSHKAVISNTRPSVKRSGEVVEVDGLTYCYPLGMEFLESEDKPPETFCDWLTFFTPKTGIDPNSFKKIIDQLLIGEFFKDTFEVQIYDCKTSHYRGGSEYDTTFKNEVGVKFVTKLLDSGSFRGQLVFSGSVLSQLVDRNDFLTIANLIKLCTECGLHLTRIDLTIDDFTKKLNLLEVEQWARSGNYFDFLNFEVHVSGSTLANKRATTGLTVCLGSRESQKYLRIYDTFVKHNTKAVRVELECKRQFAKSIQSFFLNFEELYLHGCNENSDKTLHGCNQKLIEEVQNIILTSLNFKDRKKGKRKGTIMEYPEFLNLTEYKKYINKNFEKRKFVARVKDLSVKSSWQFLVKSVKGTLGLFSSLGKDTFNKLIEYLLILDKEKTRPEIINKDRQLLFAELKRHRLHAIFTDEEMQKIYDDYGIDFGTNTSYYEPNIKEDSLTANKKILRSLLKDKDLDFDNNLRFKDELNNHLLANNYHQKNEDNQLWQNLLNNFDVVEFLLKNIPTTLTTLLNKFTGEKRQMLVDHISYLSLGENGQCSTVT
jgi:hypothetical protein